MPIRGPNPTPIDIKGATNEAVGKAKRAVGKATGRAKLKREGDIQEAKGDGQTAMGKVKKALKD